MAAANLAAALAPNVTVVLVPRLLVGVSVGRFRAIAGGLAVRLVPERHVGSATAVCSAACPPPPCSASPPEHGSAKPGGRRTAFAAVGVLGLLTPVALVLLLPPLPPTRLIAPPELLGLLRGNRGVRAGVIVTFLVVTGQFAAYTCVRPILQDVYGIDAHHVCTLLLGYHVAGVAGNCPAGPRDARPYAAHGQRVPRSTWPSPRTEPLRRRAGGEGRRRMGVSAAGTAAVLVARRRGTRPVARGPYRTAVRALSLPGDNDVPDVPRLP